MTGNYYDHTYFSPMSKNGGKSSFYYPFTWRYEKKGNKSHAKYIVDNFGSGKILDVGCARGFLVRALWEMGYDAYGCDVSEWAIRRCDKKVRGKVKCVDITQGLPYPDGAYNVVCSIHTLEHIEIEQLDSIIAEMGRVSNRWVYINLPIGMVDENNPVGDPSHKTYVPISFWVSLFYKNGLLLDMTKSRQDIVYPHFHNAGLAFYKKGVRFD